MDGREAAGPLRDGRIELSVVTVTPDGLPAIERTLAALRAQDVPDRIEVVVVAPRQVPAGAESLRGFGAVRLVAVGKIESVGRAIAAGVRAASGPIVAYAEEHSFPEPGWAAALIERHREPWAAVAWAVENANPKRTISWAQLLAVFGPAAAPVVSGEREGALPWHHVSYKREELLAFGERLGELLEAEGILHDELRARGRRLYLEGAAASRHVNVSRLASDLRSRFHGGRGFGAARARREGWSATRRLAFALAFPLLPFVRLRRLVPDIRRTRVRSRSRRGLMPLLALTLVADGLGEAVGCICGAGRSHQRVLTIDLERARHLAAKDAG